MKAQRRRRINQRTNTYGKSVADTAPVPSQGGTVSLGPIIRQS